MVHVINFTILNLSFHCVHFTVLTRLPPAKELETLTIVQAKYGDDLGRLNSYKNPKAASFWAPWSFKLNCVGKTGPMQASKFSFVLNNLLLTKVHMN